MVASPRARSHASTFGTIVALNGVRLWWHLRRSRLGNTPRHDSWRTRPKLDTISPRMRLADHATEIRSRYTASHCVGVSVRLQNLPNSIVVLPTWKARCNNRCNNADNYHAVLDMRGRSIVNIAMKNQIRTGFRKKFCMVGWNPSTMCNILVRSRLLVQLWLDETFLHERRSWFV